MLPSDELARKCARIFVLGHYLFIVAHSFPRATLSANCSLLGKYNIQKGAIVGNTSGFKYWGISEYSFT